MKSSFPISPRFLLILTVVVAIRIWYANSLSGATVEKALISDSQVRSNLRAENVEKRNLELIHTNSLVQLSVNRQRPLKSAPEVREGDSRTKIPASRGTSQGELVVAKSSTEKHAFFRTKIEPILKQSCQRCHGEKKQESGLRLDNREDMVKGGENGPAIVSGKPDESLLIKVLDYTGDIQMPPDAKLDSEKIADLKKWIELDAPWPGN